MPHIHLSLQSGDNMILKRMKRRHAREDSIAFCQELRARRPDIVFGADIIAGFPTETDEMFENSLRIVDDCGLTYLHVFPFSPRPGTPAARMPQLDKAVIKARPQRLRRRAQQRLDSFLAGEVGATRQVLIETEATGRTEHFAQVSFASRMAPGAIVHGAVTGRGAWSPRGQARRMSGFFKKLFNRITGKKEEAAPPPAMEALPEPEAFTEPVVVPEPEPQPQPERQPEPVAVAPSAEPEPEPEPEAVAEPAPVAPREEPRPAKAKPAIAKTKPKPETAPPKPSPKAKTKVPEPPATKPDAKAKAKVLARSVEPKPATKKAAPKPVRVTQERPKPAPRPAPVPIPEPEELTPPAPEVIAEPPVVALPPEPVAPPDVAPTPAAAEFEPDPPPAVPAPPQAAEEAQQRRGWFSRLKEGLSKSSKSITGSITSIFTKRKLDKDTLQDLEDVLLQADLGLPMAERIVRAVSDGPL